MVQAVKVDVAIFGGGIAGLWALTRLRQAGYAAVLFETEALGAGQTVKSQGIIHGGMKYALHGALTSEVTTMAAMPTLWQDCLHGLGEINLSKAALLSKTQYLWSPGLLTAKITGFLAGMAMRSKVAAVKPNDYPDVFQNKKFKGALYALDEIVLDVPSVIDELSTLNRGAIFKIRSLTQNDLHFDAQGRFLSADLHVEDTKATLTADHVVFVAGEGNALVVNQLKRPGLGMQRRPLHMVMVKTPFYYPLYAHCMGVGQRPRLTVTTHRLQNGEAVWYLGGLLAEEGNDRDAAAQIQAAKHELENLFPWLDFSAAKYATLRVDRAEPKTADGLKPETFFAESNHNLTVAWPTKLALAPALAASIVETIKARRFSPSKTSLPDWPAPSVAKPLWETCLWKSAD
ncbi:MAG TPA: FAD-dependent oxidoreductase [Gammaproteobacteria bacterium]|jgi:glycerol-3-phosphate dehydrogenase|nr:FAD-dependent oxidoreductase [Gammaproteobacteria bacterium]